MRAKLAQQLGVCQQLVLQGFVKRRELCVEGIVKKYSPNHGKIMDWKSYFVKLQFLHEGPIWLLPAWTAWPAFSGQSTVPG